MNDIVDRINADYLFAGGLFNPERANHDAVRDLIRDCRDEIKRLEKNLDSRDDFIVKKGLWAEFVDTLELCDEQYR